MKVVDSIQKTETNTIDKGLYSQIKNTPYIMRKVLSLQ